MIKKFRGKDKITKYPYESNISFTKSFDDKKNT